MVDRADAPWDSMGQYWADMYIAEAISEFANVDIVRHLGGQLDAGPQHRLGRRPGMFARDGVHLLTLRGTGRC